MTADHTGQPDSLADLVATGGTVLTFDGRNRCAAGLATRAGRIVAVGSAAEMERHIGPHTHVIDLAGRTVVPGINDSHLHATWLGAMWPRTLLTSGESMQPPPAVRLRDAAERRAAILRAGELCAALGITSYTEPGLGPGEDGGETGCFSQAVLDDYAALAATGMLRARVTVLRLFGLLDGPSTLDDFERGMGLPAPVADPAWLNVTGVKIFADGIPPMGTAWTAHGCASSGHGADGGTGHGADGGTGHGADGATGHGADGGTGHGGLLVDGRDDDERERRFRRMVELAHAAGWQIGVHATGDRSIEVFVDAVADTVRRHGRRARHYVIHGDLAAPGQLARMGELGIGLCAQPGIATATAELVAAALGDDVAAAAWPLARALKAGVTLTLSSDAPVLGPDWRQHVAAAAEWMGSSGTQPELTARLLRCYTTEAAVQDGAEAWKGSLEAGKVADFCVLAENPLTVPPAELPDVAVDTTVVAGQPVFTRAQ
ncbi:metal-dependent hydrolase [Actinobacteria bacterium YIM 96077]|uniref:Metal-dependent hydrolase n=1 Tax=Phytoactinopolyspora halophila TaxID=1981511 RepID=A0A329QK26_9ACTN|nr:amidohydrolase family protein [Phytoactinopolyspora halophila]AYY12520.1 metal-dependent hydrolase [Actinobacteria bacterium YIM 96077]RAW12576.1 metal-dependent hydrolase [Phytoactinopolyspora halophila]